MDRISRAAAAAVAAGLDGLLITPGPDLRYLTGYSPLSAAERLMVLVVRPGEEPVLVLPAFERGDAPDGLRYLEWSDGEDPYARAATLLSAGRYAISDAAWALHAFGLARAAAGATLASMSDALPLLRAIKDADELGRMARAGAAVDATFDALLGLPFAGRRELDVAADLAALLREHGHESVDFTIVGSGPNGANPHHGASARVIAPGDMVVLDFGGFVDGYGSDTTRTVVVGEPTAEQRRAHDVVREAQQIGVDAVRPGVACQDVDRAVREHIAAAGFGEYFTHRTGHGIGVETHEPPYIVEGSTQPLAPGMCFSIEPGVYFPGRFGVRIEDIVAVTESGVRRLNESTREPRAVG
ncbi:MAG TPA: aminopeptidase P family protein [Solirubrobacteraceae bacterium]|nr:aminopeptidase P family protein [Solirubrobacteraceae bacterium]